MPFHGLYHCKWLADGSKTLPEMATQLEAAAVRLKAMHADGVQLDGTVDDDYAELVTDNPEIAKKYGLTEPQADDEEETETVVEQEQDGSSDDNPGLAEEENDDETRHTAVA